MLYVRGYQFNVVLHLSTRSGKPPGFTIHVLILVLSFYWFQSADPKVFIECLSSQLFVFSQLMFEYE